MKLSFCTCVLLIAILAGCEGPAPVRPGTRGTIRHGENPLADVRVTVHRVEDDDVEVVGFGVSNLQGKFGLFQMEAAGPLWLEAAEYTITLQSEGAIPFAWPSEYQDAKKTPLKQRWSNEDSELDLDVMNPSPLRDAPRRGR